MDFTVLGSGCQFFVPSSGEVGIATAIKSFLGIGSERDSNITRFLKVPNKIENCSFSMWFTWIQRVLSQLVRGIHDFRPSGLGQIVEFTNHGSVIEVQCEGRFINMSMQMLVNLGWYSLYLETIEACIFIDGVK